MTKKEFLEEYGNVPVIFSSYYKYSFTFQGTLSNGDIVECAYGGYADDIYRFEVTPNEEVLISALDPYKGSIIRNSEVLDDFYEW